MSVYTNDNVNYSFRKEPDAGKPHVRNSVRGHDRKECTYSTNEEENTAGSDPMKKK